MKTTTVSRAELIAKQSHLRDLLNMLYREECRLRDGGIMVNFARLEEIRNERAALNAEFKALDALRVAH